MPDLTGFNAGLYSVCGLSYLLTDSTNIPAPDGILTIGDLSGNLSGAAPWFCGDLTATCVQIDIVAPPSRFFWSTICDGSVYSVGDSLVTETGQSPFTLQNSFQCDSIINLNLTVIPINSTYLTETVCFGGSYQVGDSIYSNTGSYVTLLQDPFGCDSLVFLDLTVLAEIETFLVDTICQGDTYVVGGNLITTPGS